MSELIIRQARRAGWSWPIQVIAMWQKCKEGIWFFAKLITGCVAGYLLIALTIALLG